MHWDAKSDYSTYKNKDFNKAEIVYLSFADF